MIELVVVLGIITVLAMLMAPAVISARKSAVEVSQKVGRGQNFLEQYSAPMR
jgi:type II secretory pathway pseudopilin PulG